jgi:hypothetical protein
VKYVRGQLSEQYYIILISDWGYVADVGMFENYLKLRNAFEIVTIKKGRFVDYLSNPN